MNHPLHCYFSHPLKEINPYFLFYNPMLQECEINYSQHQSLFFSIVDCLYMLFDYGLTHNLALSCVLKINRNFTIERR